MIPDVCTTKAVIRRGHGSPSRTTAIRIVPAMAMARRTGDRRKAQTRYPIPSHRPNKPKSNSTIRKIMTIIGSKVAAVTEDLNIVRFIPYFIPRFGDACTG